MRVPLRSNTRASGCIGDPQETTFHPEPGVRPSSDVNCASRCCAIDEYFGARVAHRELAHYRRGAMAPSTRSLISAIAERGVASQTVLDVGGGIGSVAFELLRAGAKHATLVDASSAYAAAADQEARRQGLTERLSIAHGDFVELAQQLPPADVTTLDKVVCCYPDMERLIETSAASTRRVYGLVYPREAWWTRAAVAAQNAIRRLRRNTFRVYVHSNAAIETTIRRAGLSLLRRQRGLVWVVDLYERPRAAT